MDDFMLEKNECKKRDIYKLFFHEDETVSNLSLENENISPSQRVDIILGRTQKQVSHDFDKDFVNSPQYDKNHSDYCDDTYPAEFANSGNNIFNLTSNENQNFDQNSNFQDVFIGDSKSDSRARVDKYYDGELREPRLEKLATTQNSTTVILNSGQYNISNNNNDFRKNNYFKKHNATSKKVKKKDFVNLEFRQADNNSESSHNVLDKLKNSLQSRLNLKKPVDLDVFYCNNNINIKDELEGLSEDKDSDSDDLAYSRYNENDYESELTDLENWQHFVKEDSFKFRDVISCIKENQKISILLLILLLFAVALLITLIAVVTKK